jgi:glycosyltransferase involved in cell wall biosynthesis
VTRARLAIFLPDARGGGAERTYLELAATFAERCDVDLVLATAGGDLIDRVSSSVRVIELGARRVATSLPALVRYVRRTRPDAILSNLGHTNVVAILARSLARTPTRVVVCEQNHLSTATDGSRRMRDRLLPFLLGRLYGRADAVIAVSRGVADDLGARLGLDIDIEVIPNPIDSADLRRQAVGPSGHPWLDGEGPPVAVAVGRLTTQKDFTTLLRAVATCRASTPLRLVILGEGEERQALETEVARLGLADAVSMPGFVANPYRHMRAADVFVLSSRWEGLPTVLLETRALGTPIVSTDCPSGPATILCDGALGRLVPVGDHRALAAALIETLGERHDRTGDPLDEYRPEVVRAAYARVLGLRLDG